MGSSYRTDLLCGRMPRQERKLRAAINLIDAVQAEWDDLIGDDGQFDNAADDGAFCEVLRIARSLLEGEISGMR